MNPLLLRSYMPRSGLASLEQYRATEGTLKSGVVADCGGLIEFETLELRLHPPNVSIDQEEDAYTTITLDSANRPGTLIEVVQVLTELGLNVRKARISSDGGWFVDEFMVDRVTDDRKLMAVRRVLSACEVEEEAGAEAVFELAGTDRAGLLADIVLLLKANGFEVRSAAVWTYNERVAFVISVVEFAVSCTTPPLLAGLAPAAARPSRGAHDPAKLHRLKQLCAGLMDRTSHGDVIANVQVVRADAVHHERRLHQLLLKEEEAQWNRQHPQEHVTPGGEVTGMVGVMAHEVGGSQNSPRSSCSGGSSVTDVMMGSSQTCSGTQWELRSCASMQPEPRHNGRVQLAHAPSMPAATQGNNCDALQPPLHAPALAVMQPTAPVLISPKADKPSIKISFDKKNSYWVCSITCKDRKKLLFDCVCTLADLQYDIYHGSVDVEEPSPSVKIAHQMYYIRPRFGDSAWDAVRADKLKSLLDMAIQRRFPRGVKIRIQSWQQYDLAALTAAWRDAGLLITRAKVRPCLGGPAGSVSNTFYLLDRSGDAPDPRAVVHSCEAHGGVPLTLADLSGLVSRVSSTHSSGVHSVAPALLGKPPRANASTAAPSHTGSVTSDYRERYKGASFGFAVLQRTAAGSVSSMATSS